MRRGCFVADGLWLLVAGAQSKRVGSLSGGWRMKLALGAGRVAMMR
jgi:hypothetical protein